MKKLIKTHYAYILIFAFIIISGFTMFMCCDDYIWFYAFSDDRLSSYASPNGRYFTNFITRFSVQCLPLYSFQNYQKKLKKSLDKFLQM